MSKSLAIIGGGLAGLAAAVFLADKGLSVSLYESSPRWGGKTFSYHDKEKNLFIDNGQHILAGWYKNTFEYLKKIGTYDKLIFKDNLSLDFFNKDKTQYHFESGNLPGIYSLLSGVFGFPGFNLNDKIKFLKIKKALTGKSYSEDYLKNINAESLLNQLGQTDNLKKYFWTPLILAAFNTIPEFVSADLFVKLLKKGTENKKNMSLILTGADLNGIFINSAIDYLEKKSIKLYLKSPVRKINIGSNEVENIEMENGNTVKADYYVCSVPFFNFEKLFEKEIYSQYFCDAGKLKPSTIISVHLFLDRDFECESNMIGLIDTVVQWIFVTNKRHLCIVISGADYIENNLTEKDNSEIYKICLEDIKSCLENFDEKSVVEYKILKEKRATFLPDTGSEKFRVKQDCKVENLFIGGDWTDTGYPATIEGAVKSAKICSDLVVSKFN